MLTAEMLLSQLKLPSNLYQNHQIKLQHNILKNSKAKIDQKNCDWIIANDVSNNSIGFGSDLNEVIILYKDKTIEKLPKMKKSLLANKIVKKVISQIN